MKTKLIKAYGAVGMAQAIKAVEKVDLTKDRGTMAPEAIWRPRKGVYARAYNMGGFALWSDVPGSYWYSATLTIEQAYIRRGW